MQTHIKQENLTDAIDALEKYGVKYHITKGTVFGLPCYWLDFERHEYRVDAMRSIYHLAQHHPDS